MEDFAIESCKSDLRLIFSNPERDSLDACLKSAGMSVTKKIFSVSSFNRLADLLEQLAARNLSWGMPGSWHSLERDLEIDISCNHLGHVIFHIRLHRLTGLEDWTMSIELYSELGRLSEIGEAARSFLTHRLGSGNHMPFQV